MPEENQKHYRKIKYILLGILVLNWGVALAKIIYGSLSRCESMAADGFHSLSDGASNIIGIIGVYFASRPQDKDHPYGHKKYETFFSLAIAILLFVIAFNLAKAGLLHLRHPAVPSVNAISFMIMLVTITVNLWVMNYEYKKGKELKSDILIADSLHTGADILTSVSVIIALVVIKLGYPLIDSATAVIISLFIAYTGIKIIKEGQAVLCDTAVILNDEQISSIVLKIPGVKTCHKIRTRGRPDDIQIDLHVQVSAEMHMDKAHRISYAIEEAIKQQIPGVTDVMVHMEPKE